MSWLSVVANWGNGVRESYAYNTSVFVTDDGHEQRRSKIARARRSLEFAALMDGERPRDLSDALERAQDGRVSLGDLAADPAIVRVAASTDGALLRIERAPAWLGHAMPAALVVGRKAYLVNVDVVIGLNITLTDSLPVAVPVGAFLVPAIDAAMRGVETNMLSSEVGSASVRVDVAPGTPVRTAGAIPAGEILLGRQALLRSPNFISTPRQAFSTREIEVDYGRGVVRAFSPIPMIQRMFTATYLELDRAAAEDLVDVFLRARGRAGEVFIPSWGSDFPAPISAAGASLTFEGRDLFDTYATSVTHRSVLISGRDGAIVLRDVGQITLLNGNSVCTFDASLGISLNSIVKISWLYVARFAEDVLTVEWISDSVANISMSFVVLRNLPVEDIFASNWILDTHFWRDVGQWEDTAEWRD